MKGVGPPLTYPGEGESGYEDVREIICHGSAGAIAIRVGYLGGDPQNGAEPGGVPRPSGAANHGEANGSMCGWELGINLDSGGTKGSGD